MSKPTANTLLQTNLLSSFSVNVNPNNTAAAMGSVLQSPQLLAFKTEAQVSTELAREALERAFQQSGVQFTQQQTNNAIWGIAGKGFGIGIGALINVLSDARPAGNLRADLGASWGSMAGPGTDGKTAARILSDMIGTMQKVKPKYSRQFNQLYSAVLAGVGQAAKGNPEGLKSAATALNVLISVTTGASGQQAADQVAAVLVKLFKMAGGKGAPVKNSTPSLPQSPITPKPGDFPIKVTPPPTINTDPVYPEINFGPSQAELTAQRQARQGLQGQYDAVINSYQKLTAQLQQAQKQASTPMTKGDLQQYNANWERFSQGVSALQGQIQKVQDALTGAPTHVFTTDSFRLLDKLSQLSDLSSNLVIGFGGTGIQDAWFRAMAERLNLTHKGLITVDPNTQQPKVNLDKVQALFGDVLTPAGDKLLNLFYNAAAFANEKGWTLGMSKDASEQHEDTIRLAAKEQRIVNSTTALLKQNNLPADIDSAYSLIELIATAIDVSESTGRSPQQLLTEASQKIPITMGSNDSGKSKSSPKKKDYIAWGKEMEKMLRDKGMEPPKPPGNGPKVGGAAAEEPEDNPKKRRTALERILRWETITGIVAITTLAVTLGRDYLFTRNQSNEATRNRQAAEENVQVNQGNLDERRKQRAANEKGATAAVDGVKATKDNTKATKRIAKDAEQQRENLTNRQITATQGVTGQKIEADDRRTNRQILSDEQLATTQIASDRQLSTDQINSDANLTTVTNWQSKRDSYNNAVASRTTNTLRISNGYNLNVEILYDEPLKHSNGSTITDSNGRPITISRGMSRIERFIYTYQAEGNDLLLQISSNGRSMQALTPANDFERRAIAALRSHPGGDISNARLNPSIDPQRLQLIDKAINNRWSNYDAATQWKIYQAYSPFLGSMPLLAGQSISDPNRVKPSPSATVPARPAPVLLTPDQKNAQFIRHNGGRNNFRAIATKIQNNNQFAQWAVDNWSTLSRYVRSSENLRTIVNGYRDNGNTQIITNLLSQPRGSAVANTFSRLDTDTIEVNSVPVGRIRHVLEEKLWYLGVAKPPRW